MLPNITATGTLGADPVLKFTPSGKAVANFRIACNKRKKDDAGNWSDVATVWLGVSVWERDAEAVAEHLKKGDTVTVTGQLLTREYEKDGQTRTAVEVEFANVSKALPRNGSAPSGGFNQPPAARPAADPWATGPANSEPPF